MTQAQSTSLAVRLGFTGWSVEWNPGPQSRPAGTPLGQEQLETRIQVHATRPGSPASSSGQEETPLRSGTRARPGQGESPLLPRLA